MAKSEREKPYWRPYSPGMGCAGRNFPGEHPAGIYTPPPPGEGGAAEALQPEANWSDEERGRSLRRQIKSNPPGSRW